VVLSDDFESHLIWTPAKTMSLLMRLDELRGLPRETLFEGADWPLFGDVLGPFSAFCEFQAYLSRGCRPLAEDQAVEVVSEVGQREFGPRAGNVDGADEEAIAVLLMLDSGTDR
jgi:hypothetical protein